MAIIKTQLTQELRDYVEENYGDLQSYLLTLIESTILGLKH